MCESFASEARFVARLEQKYGRCETCGNIKNWCPQYCEESPLFADYFKSSMFDPTIVKWKKRK